MNHNLFLRALAFVALEMMNLKPQFLPGIQHLLFDELIAHWSPCDQLYLRFRTMGHSDRLGRRVGARREWDNRPTSTSSGSLSWPRGCGSSSDLVRSCTPAKTSPGNGRSRPKTPRTPAKR